MAGCCMAGWAGLGLGCWCGVAAAWLGLKPNTRAILSVQKQFDKVIGQGPTYALGVEVDKNGIQDLKIGYATWVSLCHWGPLCHLGPVGAGGPVGVLPPGAGGVLPLGPVGCTALVPAVARPWFAGLPAQHHGRPGDAVRW